MMYWPRDYNRPEDSRSTTMQTCPAQNSVVSSFYAEINTQSSHATPTSDAAAGRSWIAETYTTYLTIISHFFTSI